MAINYNQEDILVHWTYTHDEWKTFLRWKKWKKGILHYVIHKIVLDKKERVTEVLITCEQIFNNNNAETFSGKQNHLKRVNIRDVGDFNIIEIVYEDIVSKSKQFKEILLPVPKGKLKEAMDVQQKLIDINHLARNF